MEKQQQKTDLVNVYCMFTAKVRYQFAFIEKMWVVVRNSEFGEE